MERIILFAVAAIIWSVVKALSKPAPQRPVPRQTQPQTSVPVHSESIPKPRLRETYAPATYFAEQPELNLDVVELDADIQEEMQISSQDLLRGIIMAEVLSPPRARRPHTLTHR